MAFFNWKLNEKWVFNQDVAWMHSYETPTFTRYFLRSQFNRQLSGLVSVDGGLINIYTQNEDEDDAIEIRPWLGTKLRWPSFWRINLVHYLRFEQRFSHTMGIDDWENNFRMRYKLGTSIPINHHSLTDKTFFGILAYEFYSVSFDVDIRFAAADIHRFDVGLGYRQNVKNSFEAVAVAFNNRDDQSEHYELSSLVLFLKYKHYFNWE